MDCFAPPAMTIQPPSHPAPGGGAFNICVFGNIPPWASVFSAEADIKTPVARLKQRRRQCAVRHRRPDDADCIYSLGVLTPIAGHTGGGPDSRIPVVPLARELSLLLLRDAAAMPVGRLRHRRL